jgi:CheY-like chemotaxis protein
MTQTIRVLFIYDNEAALAVRSGMLESYEQIEVLGTTDVSTALAMLDDQRIDCVLSGYALAGTDGISLTRTIRQSHPQLPVILFADGLSPELLETAFEAGITDHTSVSVCQVSYSRVVERIYAATQQPTVQSAQTPESA